MADSSLGISADVGFAELTRSVSNARNRAAVLFLPHAGGDHNSYRVIAGHIREAAVFGAVYPGRLAGAATGPMDIAGVANKVAESFPWEAFERVMIVGHSMGGLIAHALCAALELRDYQPDRVIISSTVPPRPALIGDLLPTESGAVLQHIVALGGTPPELLDSAWFREEYIPMITSDYQAVNDYMTTAPPIVQSDLQLFSADQDASTSPEAMLGWREYTTGGATVTTFPGGHFYILEHPSTVAKYLNFQPYEQRSTS